MGLDMYLTQSVYIGASNDKRQGNLKIETAFSKKKLELPLSKINFIELDFLYWRKSSHIHRWFVDNVQGGKDDCGRYIVSNDDLMKLYNNLKLAILKQDPTIMPPVDGFFFGSTEIDDFYWQEINRTAAAIKPIIDELKKPFDSQTPIIQNSDFYYTSSW